MKSQILFCLSAVVATTAAAAAPGPSPTPAPELGDLDKRTLPFLKDKCLKGFEGSKGGDAAYSFCQTYTTEVVTATSLPEFASPCTPTPL